jgi:hypothetical protein
MTLTANQIYTINLTYKDGKRGIFPTKAKFKKLGKDNHGRYIALFDLTEGFKGSPLNGFQTSILPTLIK